MPEAVFEGWRVEDDDSHVQYRLGHGIQARSQEFVRMDPRDQFEWDKLYEKVHQHIDWYNEVHTPFISVYNNE